MRGDRVEVKGMTVEAEEDVVRWLAGRGYGPHAICRAVAWLKEHGTLATCPHINHAHATAGSLVAGFANELSIKRNIRNN